MVNVLVDGGSRNTKWVQHGAALAASCEPREQTGLLLVAGQRLLRLVFGDFSRDFDFHR